jgi:hypothetical protein
MVTGDASTRRPRLTAKVRRSDRAAHAENGRRRHTANTRQKDVDLQDDTVTLIWEAGGYVSTGPLNFARLFPCFAHSACDALPPGFFQRDYVFKWLLLCH